MKKQKPGPDTSRRRFLKAGVLAGAGASAGAMEAAAHAMGGQVTASTTSQPNVKPFELDERLFPNFNRVVKSGKRPRRRALTERYLSRIDEIDKRGPTVNSIIELNPDAASIAAGLDEERQAGRAAASGCTAIRVLIKDNIGTHDRDANHRRVHRARRIHSRARFV